MIEHDTASYGAQLPEGRPRSTAEAPETSEQVEAPWSEMSKDTPDIEAMFAAYRGGPVSACPHVMMATPAYNPPGLEFLRARELVCESLAKFGVDYTVLTTPGDSLVMRGRHAIVHEFLCSPATHLLFWDVDIEPLDPDVVRQMLVTGHDIVGGACPFRSEIGRVVCNLTPEDRARKSVDTDDVSCVKVSEVGTGFLLMSRAAIVKLCEAHPELQYFSDLPSCHGAPMWALFDTAIENRRFLSEDYFFCRLWRATGGTVHVYVPFEAQHWGRKGYRASFVTAWGLKTG